MLIRPVNQHDALALSIFYSKNKEHLAPWEPSREPEYFTEHFWSNRLLTWIEDTESGSSAHYVSIAPSNDVVLAACSLTNITRGPFQACNIGYAVSAEMQGTGTMTALVQYVTATAFDELGLNRVMANYLPRNKRSAQLLNRLGFIKEGLAKRYLLINGVWEDHVLTSKVNPSTQ